MLLFFVPALFLFGLKCSFFALNVPFFEGHLLEFERLLRCKRLQVLACIFPYCIHASNFYGFVPALVEMSLECPCLVTQKRNS